MSGCLFNPCASADMARMIKALHPRFTKGMLHNMLEVCMNTCKMTKDHPKQYCSFDEVRRVWRVRSVRWVTFTDVDVDVDAGCG